MSKSIQFNERTGTSKSIKKQGKHSGLIPAVVYGIGKPTVSVEVSEKEVLDVLKQNPRAILQASTPTSGIIPVIIKDVQRETLTGKLLHIDFLHVNMLKSMDSKIVIHFSGEAAGVKAGGILQVEMHEILIRCMPDCLQASVEVDVSALAIGDQLLVSNLVFGDGVEVLSSPTAVIVQIKNPHNEAAEEESA